MVAADPRPTKMTGSSELKNPRAGDSQRVCCCPPAEMTTLAPKPERLLWVPTRRMAARWVVVGVVFS